jgi:murein DD-endopeptidase MepM/ murein hydrolase activator NlpD
MAVARYIVCLLGPILVCVTYAQTPSQNIQKEIRKNNEIIDQKKQEERTILKELGALRTTIYVTQKKLDRAYNQYNSYTEQIRINEKKLADQEAQYRHVSALLEQKLITLYKQNHRPALNLIFNTDSFSSIINNLYLYEKIIKDDFNKISDAKEKINDYRTSQKRLEFSKKEVDKLKKSILDKRYTLKSTQSLYQKNLVSLREELQAFEERNTILRQESRQLGLIIQDNTPDHKYLGTGSYVRPAGGYISSRFGLRRHPIFKSRRLHTGIDFAAPRGYKIKATDSGNVIFSGFKEGYGNVTIIDHGSINNKRLSSLYAHQWKILVKKGQFVQKGQLIGYVGSTGYSTGPHLHFEIRENGNPVNPSQYLQL